jgi:hypothetical protein
MALNRSDGPTEFHRKAGERDHEQMASSAAASADVCRLLNTLMNATLRQLNTKLSQDCSLSFDETEIAEILAHIARQYKRNLELTDVVDVAISTSRDLKHMKTLIGGICDSRSLDQILATSNRLLDEDHITLTRCEQEIWLGRRVSKDQAYYLSARIISYPYFDAAPPPGQALSLF